LAVAIGASGGDAVDGGVVDGRDSSVNGSRTLYI